MLVSGHDDVLVQKRMRGLREETRTTFRDCGVRAWEVGTWKLAREFKWDNFGPNAVCISPGGDRVAALLTRDIKVWTLADGRELAAFHLQEAGTNSAIQFREDGIRALNTVGFFDSDIWLYNVSFATK